MDIRTERKIKMEYLETLTSQYSPSELYGLVTDTIAESGNGGNALLTATEDIISIEEDGSIWLKVIKEIDNERFIVSKKQLKAYDLHLLFGLFENVYDNHLFKEEAAKEAREALRTNQEKDD